MKCVCTRVKSTFSTVQQSSNKMQLAYSKVHVFWNTYGRCLEAEHGPGTFAYELVVKMAELHACILAVPDQVLVDWDLLHRKIQDIMSLQRRHIIQFEFCLDDFNRYMTVLGQLDVLLRFRTITY